MNDKELADKVVALGVAARSGEAYALISNDPDDFFTYAMGKARYFVRDWRVAGLLMGKMVYEELLDMLGNRPAITIDDPVKPRDIIEAYVEALELVETG